MNWYILAGNVTDGIAKGVLKITNPTLWWPWTLSSNPGAMQPFQVYNNYTNCLF